MFINLYVKLMLARPPATMVAKTASIVIGGHPKHSNRLITYNKYCYVLVLVLLDHNMVFGYGYCWWQQSTMTNKCTSSASCFDSHGGAPEQYRSLPNAACPGLLRKPLDTGIGRLLAPYCPSGCQSNRQTINNQQIHLKRWPCWWLQWCAGTIPRALPDGGGPGLYKKPLHAAIGWVLCPIT